MSDIRARATGDGTVMLAITDGDGRRAHVELPIEVAEKLKRRSKPRWLLPEPIPRRSLCLQEATHGWKQTSFLEMSGGEGPSGGMTLDRKPK